MQRKVEAIGRDIDPERRNESGQRIPAEQHKCQWKGGQKHDVKRQDVEKRRLEPQLQRSDHGKLWLGKEFGDPQRFAVHSLFERERIVTSGDGRGHNRLPELVLS